MKFYVGDKVTLHNNFWGPAPSVVGCIMYIVPESIPPTNRQCAVRFPKGEGEHDCGGHCPPRTGLWVREANLKLATPSENRR